jgi:hypothetical protein
VNLQVDFNNKKEVLEKYPWLNVRHRFSGELIEDEGLTEFDIMEVPKAWKNTFIPNMIEEIDQLLKKANYIQEYQILQVKEKYGTLRWYDAGFPTDYYEELQQIIDKYEKISEFTCSVCGKYDQDEVQMRQGGWISAYCKEHMK